MKKKMTQGLVSLVSTHIYTHKHLHLPFKYILFCFFILIQLITQNKKE
jgi:hypothetical protein